MLQVRKWSCLTPVCSRGPPSTPEPTRSPMILSISTRTLSTIRGFWIIRNQSQERIKIRLFCWRIHSQRGHRSDDQWNSSLRQTHYHIQSDGTQVNTTNIIEQAAVDLTRQEICITPPASPHILCIESLNLYITNAFKRARLIEF